VLRKVRVHESRKIFEMFCNSRWILEKFLCVFGCPRFRFDEFGVGFVIPFH
jgi:hypothetical protein